MNGSIACVIVIRQNLLHEPRVNRESLFRVKRGFLRQTANDKMKVSSNGSWKFKGLAGKKTSPSFLLNRGWTPTVCNCMEATSL